MNSLRFLVKKIQLKFRYTCAPTLRKQAIKLYANIEKIIIIANLFFRTTFCADSQNKQKKNAKYKNSKKNSFSEQRAVFEGLPFPASVSHNW